MAGVRAKKTRKNKTIKILKNTRKKKKKINPSVGDAVLKQHWDTSKTLQQNLKSLGLAYDSNESVKIHKEKKIKRKDLLREDQGIAAMEVEKPAVNTAVIEAFETQAANGQKLERHIAPGEAKFLMDLIDAHGKNYKKMCKDKRNTYQHTANQLRRKCEGLLTSASFPKYKEMYPGLLPAASMDTNE